MFKDRWFFHLAHICPHYSRDFPATPRFSATCQQQQPWKPPEESPGTTGLQSLPGKLRSSLGPWMLQEKPWNVSVFSATICIYLSYSKNLVMVLVFQVALSGTGWLTHRKTYWPFDQQVGSLQPDHGPHGSGYRIPRPANPAKPTSKVDNIPCMLQ